MIVAIIPARSKSKRLKNKNVLPIKGMPMFVFVANILKKSKYISKIYISTESKKYINICKKFNLNFIKRPKSLSGDKIEKQEVIVHATKKILRSGLNVKTVISIQPNSPELKLSDLHKALKFFSFKLYPKSNVKELICINSKNIQNPSFRILTTKAVFQKTLSTKIGVYKADYVDIHTKKDYLLVKKKIEKIK